MTMPKKPPIHATGSIVLTTPEPITKDTPLDWAWTIDGLSGREYPMVIVRVESDDGDILYARLDHPDVRPWVISDGSCPWTNPTNPHYGEDGVGQVQLWVYVPFRQQGPGDVYMVAATPEFPVTWA